MTDNRDWFVKSVDGKVYGPAKISKLVEWAKDGRIEPTGFVSVDRVEWLEACTVDALEMKWLVEVSPGDVFGPFHRELVISLFKNGTVPATARAYRLHEFPIDQDPPPIEKIVEKEVRVEVPVEKIVEKVVEKVVVDETRVSELEGLLAEERRHTADLQQRMDETLKKASEAAKAAREAQSALKAKLSVVASAESIISTSRSSGSSPSTKWGTFASSPSDIARGVS